MRHPPNEWNELTGIFAGQENTRDLANMTEYEQNIFKASFA